MNSYEIVFDINVTRLDDTIYDKVMKIEKDDSSEYRDIYLYRLESLMNGKETCCLQNIRYPMMFKLR